MRIDKRIVLGVLGLTLILMGVYIQPIFDQVRVMVFMKMMPLDVVFDDGIDLSKYDGGVILNCLRDKNFCPEGVHYKDDVTGEVFASNPDQPKTFQPVVGAPNPTTEMFINDAPPNIQNTLVKLDMLSYVIIGIIVGGLVIAFVYLLVSKRRKVKIG